MGQKMILGTEENSAAYVDSDIKKGTVGLAVETTKCPFTGLSFTSKNADKLVQALQEAIKEIDKAERKMEIKKFTIEANTPMELERQINKETASGEWELQGIIKKSPILFDVTLGKN